LERGEHRRHASLPRRHPRAGREPTLDRLEVVAIAHTQALVTHALAARQQAVGELLRLETRFALDRLEPLGRVARRVLQALPLQWVHLLVFAERGFVIGVARQRLRQCNSTLKRQPRSRADREVRGGRSVSEQDDVALVPALGIDADEVYPR